jgi:hypothetical protein
METGDHRQDWDKSQCQDGLQLHVIEDSWQQEIVRNEKAGQNGMEKWSIERQGENERGQEQQNKIQI